MDDQTRTYWKYEYDVTARYMIPLLEHWGISVRGASVIDVGCGEGGGLCALYDAGAVPCCGFDIEVGRVEAANRLKGHREIPFPDLPSTRLCTQDTLEPGGSECVSPHARQMQATNSNQGAEKSALIQESSPFAPRLCR